MGLNCLCGGTVLRDGDFFTAEEKFLKTASVSAGGDDGGDGRGGAAAEEVEIKHTLHWELFPVDEIGDSEREKEGWLEE